MIHVIRQFFSDPCPFCISCIRRLWRCHLTCSTTLCELRPLTDQQHKQNVDEFINSIDTDVICALGSQSNGGLPCDIRSRHQGSFNICFILDFPDDTTRLVRLPIGPASHDIWEKVQSEVCTMQYLRDHTDIPIPRVYAYGRSRIRQFSSTYQPFMILEYINGQPLTKKMLRDSSELQRRQLLGTIIDIFAQLRSLTFTLGGSLMPVNSRGIWDRLRALIFRSEEFLTPQSTISHGSTKIVGAFSMRKNELQVDGYTVPRCITNNSKEFLKEQHRLLQYTWELPCKELDRHEAEREEFALRAINLEEAEKTLGLENNSLHETFLLFHPDLRVDNIIVDDELRIHGVIDWEFSATVPRHSFLPPAWITGHDIGPVCSKIDISTEFMSLLCSMEQVSPSHSQLAEDWTSEHTDRLPLANILLHPSRLVLLYYKYIYTQRYEKPLDKILPEVFRRSESKDLRAAVERRLRASRQYTQYLKDNNLFDDENEAEWQELQEWVAKSRIKIQKLRDWSHETHTALLLLEHDRAKHL